jgi:hypothetical protein
MMMMSPTAPPSRRKHNNNPHHHLSSATNNGSSPNRRLVQLGMVACLGSISLLPILILETMHHHSNNSPFFKGAPVSVDRLVNMAKHLQQGHLLPVNSDKSLLRQKQTEDQQRISFKEVAVVEKHGAEKRNDQPKAHDNKSNTIHASKDKIEKRIPTSLTELQQDINWSTSQPLSRGVAGRPISQTPALQGAKRASIACDINVDSLAYWNDPQGDRDQQFTSPFKAPEERYITFSPDRGGWNNVRMSMEIIFVIAAATGRTLVLPPKEPLYLLNHDDKAKHKGFADFYPLDTPEFQKRVKVISMKEFLEKEGTPNGLIPIPAEQREAVMSAADFCDHRKMSNSFCGPVWDFLESGVPNIHSPDVSSEETCFLFDKATYNGQYPTPEIQENIQTICGEKRKKVFFTKELQQHKVLHFRAGAKETRLLTHFYAMLHFTDVKVDHYYKRFVRDFLHYHDTIFCAAGKVVKAVQAEAVKRGFKVDDSGGSAYSSMHIRRGDLQYKRVKIPAQEWYGNTKEVWQPNEILYVATDERDKSFFDDFTVHHDLRFLDDYWTLAGLGELDGNYMGMIDTIVASRGRAFAGTFFSTFTGFINRMRGYHGMSMHDSWYSFLPKKNITQSWEIVDGPRYAYEWPDGWVGIDADEWPSRDVF